MREGKVFQELTSEGDREMWKSFQELTEVKVIEKCEKEKFSKS